MLNRLGAALTWTRNFVLNLTFVVIVIFLVTVLFSGQTGVQIADNSALVLNPKGALVEQASIREPLQELLIGDGSNAETVISDVVDAIERATEDKRIQLMVLNLDDLVGASSADAETLKPAFDAFRSSGKPIIAYGNYFTQAQYLIASFADNVYLHPLGQLMLTGFGGDRLYYKDLLDKLKVNVHVFRVGEFKSAVEPYTRNDMSAEAKTANRELYQGLWGNYASTIATNRALTSEAIERFTNDFPALLAATGGDLARTALEWGLVDELLTRDQMQERLKDLVGSNAEGRFNGVEFDDYLKGTNAVTPTGDDKVAVIVASGVLMNGESLPGVAGADTLVSLVRKARLDADVKSVVLRIDSPGGSVFASELVRQETELLQLAGKPVIASMGGVAASGGYWIASTADKIVSQETTITGSIGIFGLVPTFEEALLDIGISSDGVATSALGRGGDPLTGLSDGMKQVLQANVENGYERFLNVVARGREMTPEAVDAIGQGRVWIGSQALELGLVDQLGDLDSAIKTAAGLANLDDYRIENLEPERSPRELLLQELFGSQTSSRAGLASQLAAQFDDLLALIDRFDDPTSIYALCEVCNVRLR
jgi:protease-4